MKMTASLTDDALLQELGARIKHARVGRNLSQAQVAANTGIAKRTIERIEEGIPSNIKNFMSVVRALDGIESLNLLFPEAIPGPIECVDNRGKTRVRSSKLKVSGPKSSLKWRWGDGR